MISQIKPLVNYCKDKALKLKTKERKNLVKRIQELSTEQAYHSQVFYNAVNIADNYLLSITGK